MNSQHTPGPWICHSGMVWKPDNSPDGIPIARMDRDTSSTTPTERDANAHLIAAAPDMLDALLAISRLDSLQKERSYLQGNSALARLVNNAIDKATNS